MRTSPTAPHQSQAGPVIGGRELVVGEKYYSRMDCQVRRNSDDSTTVIISTSALDRHRTEILPNGINLKNYRKNPVVLINHWAFLLAGVSKVKKRTIEGGQVQLVATMKDSDWDHEDPDIERWYRKVVAGHMRAASIGFIIKEMKRMLIDPTGEDTWSNYKWVITKCELLEWSWVTIPSNYEALVTKAMLPKAPMGLQNTRILRQFAGEVIQRDFTLDETTQQEWSERLQPVLATAATTATEDPAEETPDAAQAEQRTLYNADGQEVGTVMVQTDGRLVTVERAAETPEATPTEIPEDPPPAEAPTVEASAVADPAPAEEAPVVRATEEEVDAPAVEAPPPVLPQRQVQPQRPTHADKVAQVAKTIHALYGAQAMAKAKQEEAKSKRDAMVLKAQRRADGKE